jgi:hypothetical protein
LLGSAQAGKRGRRKQAARVGDRRERAVGCWAESRKRENSLFFFFFKYFKAFSNYFESSFEFESNHSIQNIQM